MGNDGGSIPTRRELVKSAARAPTVSELKATTLESLGHAWTHDPLTSERLDLENVVSDWRGRLYNYESVLRGLMPTSGEDDDNNDNAAVPSLVDGESPQPTFASTGIKSLRDVVKLKFRRYAPPGTRGREVWACPVSLKELGPSTRAVYLVPCGHVFAEAAVRQIREEVCPECSEKFRAGDVIAILPTDKAEIEKLSQRIGELRAKGLTHSLRKDKSNDNNKKKKKKRKADEADTDGKTDRGDYRDAEGAVGTAGKPPPSGPDTSSRLSGINNAMTAALTARVLAEQEERNKRRKMAAATTN